MGQKITDNLASSTKQVENWTEPLIFDLNKQDQVEQLQNLISLAKVTRYSDQIELAIEELFHIKYPDQIDSVDQKLYESYKQELCPNGPEQYGCWVYYPWNGELVHFPPKNDYDQLRSSRNRNLINEQERAQLKDNKTILICGLSVGSNVVDSLILQSIGSKYILVDMDVLGPTNLNRIRASYSQLNIHKVDVMAKKISELDPYLEQVHYKDGLNEQNLQEIIKTHRPNLIVDEMDSLKMKLHTRTVAKANKLPVVMATDDGDDILLDIERFDQDSNLPLLHGILPAEVIEQVLNGPKLTRQQSGALIGKYFVNLDYVPLRMIQSLLEIGKTLPSWPQLGGAAVLSGLYVAYAAKRILLDLPINSGRFLMGPEPQLNPDIQTEDYKTRKQSLINLMKG